VKFPTFIAAALFATLSLPAAEKSIPATESNSYSAQLASIQQQMTSVDVQRGVIAKQEAAFRKAMPQAKPVADLLPPELPYFDCGSLAPRERERLVQSAARKQSVSPELLRAVIRQESAFRPCAVSDKGAQGLMQLMPATAAAFNVTDPFDPQQNILGGAAYLRQLMERYSGDASLALSAYNAGPQIVDRIAAIPNIPETKNYVTSIFRDLGWSLPTRSTVTTVTSWEEPEMESDVRPETADPEVVSPQGSLPLKLPEPPLGEKSSLPPPVIP
jgi:soluble lytic murein transglycosylase-like protein